MKDNGQCCDIESGDLVTDGGNGGDKKQTTTFTYKPETREWLLTTYPDALSINEALRMAIADARLIRDDGGIEVRAEPHSDD